MGQNKNPGVRGGFAGARAAWPALAGFLLAPSPAMAAATDAATQQFLVLGAVTTGAVALAIAAGLWALAEQSRTGKLRRALRQSGARTRAAVGERDALLSAGREALIVWGRDGRPDELWRRRDDARRLSRGRRGDGGLPGARRSQRSRRGLHADGA